MVYLKLQKLNPLAALARPCAGLKIVPEQTALDPEFKDKDKLLSPISHIGGRPLLPEGFEWPKEKLEMSIDDDFAKGDLVSCDLLCQIDLSELGSYSDMLPLPKKGILQFYVNQLDCGQSYRVLYFEDASSLKEAPLPEDLARRDKAYEIPYARLMFNISYNVPCLWEILESDAFIKPDGSEITEGEMEDLDDNYDDYYDEITNLLGKDWESDVVILGYGDFIQSCPEESDYRVLLQVNSVYEQGKIDFTIGDCGSYYFLIREEDLLQGKFENAICDMQCH